MARQHRAFIAVFLGLLAGNAARGQDGEGFSWKMGPVDLSPGQSAKLVFANPFCSNPLMKLDVTIAITDLTGQVAQMRAPGSDAAPAKKRAIISCNESIQLEAAGSQITPSGTIVGVLQLIPDLSGVPWVPVNVPLASLQIGQRVGQGFHPSVVIIPIEPVRRLILP